MLPVVVVDFDSSASATQQQVVLEACNRALRESECVTENDADSRPTRAIAVVSWPSAERAHLELGLPASDRWVSHEMRFRSEEAQTERWRAVGFTIATLLDEEVDDGGHARPVEASDEEAPDEGRRVNGGFGLGPRVGVGLDRATVLAGAELRAFASPFPSWTPVLALAYGGPASPDIDVRWRELELALGAALRQPAGDLELRWALLVGAKRIAVSDEADALAAWVAGAQLEGEVRWPARGFWALSARARAQWNDGATGIQQRGERLASSPAWLAGAGFGLEMQF